MTADADKLKKGLLFIGGLVAALGVPQMSYIALGIWARIADDDNQCLSARALAKRSPVEDEKAVLSALDELERAGLVHLERAQDADGIWTTYARIDFGAEESIWTQEIGES
jgi:hypothetical protein